MHEMLQRTVIQSTALAMYHMFMYTLNVAKLLLAHTTLLSPVIQLTASECES